MELRLDTCATVDGEIMTASRSQRSDPLAGYPTSTGGELADAGRESAATHPRLKRSLSLSEAGEVAGLADSRVRRLLEAGYLYGFKHEGRWRIPTWQFHSTGGLIPGVDEVNVALSLTLDPAEVEGFYMTPKSDLVLGGSEVSPLQWLEAGMSPEPVVLIAASL